LAYEVVYQQISLPLVYPTFKKWWTCQPLPSTRTGMVDYVYLNNFRFDFHPKLFAK